MTRTASALALAVSLLSATAAVAAPAQPPAAQKASAQKPFASQPALQVAQANQADTPAQPRKVRVVLASPYVNTASN